MSAATDTHRDHVPGQTTVTHDGREFAVLPRGRRWTHVAEYLSNGQLTACWSMDEATGEVRMSEGWMRPSSYSGREGAGAEFVRSIVAKARNA